MKESNNNQKAIELMMFKYIDNAFQRKANEAMTKLECHACLFVPKLH